ncbi:hypothetical protein AAHS21_27300 [Mycobacterium sp. 050272]|uniref:hypothetical protein n=1 Tax=Mycobacterium sp. 050272 TaxID=3142488 RepID=UPI003188FD2F
MKREVCKFFSGAFAALAYAHAAYAVATDQGIVDEPILFSRRWGIKFMWTEAAIYSVLGLVLGYFGWISKPQEPLDKSDLFATNGQSAQPVGSGDGSRLVGR